MSEVQGKSEKTKYFQRKTLSHIAEMRNAKKAGLFPKKEGWRNVIEHMVVEAEAADVLAEALGLSETERNKLYRAALSHDVYKRKERELAQEKGPSGYDEAAKLQSEWLRNHGYSEDVVELTESVGHTSLVHFQNLDQVDTIKKIMHYVDDITLNNDIVLLDQRMDTLETNPRYEELNLQGIAIFGRPYFTVQREISKKIEREFAQKLGLEDPTQLPLWIRDKILAKPMELKESKERIERIGIDALQDAFSVHNLLGADGIREIQKNQFGDTALNGDIACEEAVLDTLKRNNLPIIVHSEEHGITQIGGNPMYLGVLDGIDGSTLYKSQFGIGRYGTMFGVFLGTDPKYKDYLFSGIMEHATGRLFYAVKGKGAFVIENGQTRQIKVRDTKGLDPRHTKILADSGFDQIFNVSIIKNLTARLPEFNIPTLYSTAAQHASLINSEVDAVIECTRKDNLEIAVSYGLISEAGGVMITQDGTSLGNKRYLEFGQARGEHLPIISAASNSLARSLVDRIRVQS